MAADCSGVTSGAASSAAGAVAAFASARRTRSTASAAPLLLAVPTATPASVSRKAMTLTLRSRRVPLVVTVLLAKRSSASLDSSTMTMQSFEREAASACSTTTCASVKPPCVGAHRPASVRVFSTLMPRNSADGQPWLTGATWPGCPFPQFNAPPRR